MQAGEQILNDNSPKVVIDGQYLPLRVNHRYNELENFDSLRHSAYTSNTPFGSEEGKSVQ